MKSVPLIAGAAALGLSMAAAGAAQAIEFQVKNLVSDVLPAVTTDPNLANPWGLAFGPTGPFWVSDNGTGLSTLYNGAGAKLGLTVTIPTSAGGASPSTPTGMVFNGTASSFQINGSKPAFIFDTEQGVIAGWAPAFGTSAAIGVDRSSFDAIFKGLAIGNDGTGNVLYATNFHGGGVEIYNDTYGFKSSFTDPNVNAGYAPFNAQVLNGELYVTFALQDATKTDEQHGAGFGYVDVFNLDGTFNRRIASVGGEVNAPWGLAIAPSSFGPFAGALLVGNFGDGTISAFNSSTGQFLGKLLGTDEKPLSVDGLWALLPGNDGAGGSSQKVYFSAGIDDESHGLFGSLTSVPEPRTWVLLLAGFGLSGAMLRRRKPAATAVG